MGEVKSHQRKQYLINPGFQWKVAGAIAVAVFMFSLLISMTLYGALHQQARMRSADPTGYIAPVTSVMISFAVGFAAITAGGVGLWSILMTHRICGPMFVMKRHLLDVAQGRLPSLRPLRKRDEFKELYDAFDQAISALRSNKQRELMQLNAALEAARQAQNADVNTMHAKVEAVLERIEWLRGKAQESLAECKSQGDKTAASPAPAVAHMPA
jgi:methyl-accepting chemotaxis protein